MLNCKYNILPCTPAFKALTQVEELALLPFLSIICEGRFFVPSCGGFRFSRERKEQYLEDISLLFLFPTLFHSLPHKSFSLPGRGLLFSQLQVHCFPALTNDLIYVHVASVLPMACYSSSTNAFFLMLCASYLGLTLHAIRVYACVFMSSQCKGEGGLDLIM